MLHNYLDSVCATVDNIASDITELALEFEWSGTTHKNCLVKSAFGRVSVRLHSTLPAVTGEPFLHYAPGSAERSRLVDALKCLRSPCLTRV